MARGDTVDVESFLRRPLVARVATNGPALRPVWFVWEESALWWITDATSGLARRLLSGDNDIVAVIDSCDLNTGEVIAVSIRGTAEVVPLDRARAFRKFKKYLGSDVDTWDPGLLASVDVSTTRLVRLRPEKVIAKDMSFTASRRW